jgi:hypothetical protein
MKDGENIFIHTGYTLDVFQNPVGFGTRLLYRNEDRSRQEEKLRMENGWH